MSLQEPQPPVRSLRAPRCRATGAAAAGVLRVPDRLRVRVAESLAQWGRERCYVAQPSLAPAPPLTRRVLSLSPASSGMLSFDVPQPPRL